MSAALDSKSGSSLAMCTFQAVRLQGSLSPYAMESVLADAQSRSERPATPVGRAIPELFPGSRQLFSPCSRLRYVVGGV